MDNLDNETKRKLLKDFLEYYEATVDFLPCDLNILIDDYINQDSEL